MTRINTESLAQDKHLYCIVGAVLPQLSQLDAQQIETLIFYLKSLHSDSPKEDGELDHSRCFEDTLDNLRVSTVQKKLKAEAAKLMFIAMCVSGIAGIALAAGSLFALGGDWGWGSGLAICGIALFALAEAFFGTRALDAAKGQDRQYFLDSLRAARSCSELDWAGLFSYNGITQPGPQSNSDLERTAAGVSALALQLRSALYTDRAEQYSHLRVAASIDRDE